jgi:hypothetical protein
MTASKEFQEHLQAGQLAEAISLVVSKLVELDVTTDLAATDSTPQTTLRTHISLVTGKIVTEVNPELLNRESAQQLLDFHTAQITATNQVVRDHLHSLRELLQIINGRDTAPLTTTPVLPSPLPLIPLVMENLVEPVSGAPVLAVVPEHVPLVDADIIGAVVEPVAAPIASSSVKSPAGMAASGMAAAVAQAGSPKFDEAELLPNKFDQVLKSAGVKEETESNPFMSAPLVEPVPKSPAASGAEVSLHKSDQEWDEWLLEEDAILSELSLASEEVAKDKIPNWDEQWFASPSKKNATEDWEQFIPEYVDLDAPAHRGQANVERFRQNLVNDPQLMSELLAELDDIEKLSKDEFPKI